VVFDSWGHELASASIDETILYAEVNPAQIDEVKQQLLWHKLKRDDLYSVVNKVE